MARQLVLEVGTPTDDELHALPQTVIARLMKLLARRLTPRGAMPRETTARQPLCTDIDGFSLHAGVRVKAHDRKRLAQRCR